MNGWWCTSCHVVIWTLCSILSKSSMWLDDFYETSWCAVHPRRHWGVKYSLTDQTTKTSICCWICFKNHFGFCSSQGGCEPCGVFGVSAGLFGLSCNQFLSVCSRWGRLVVREEAAALIPAGRRLLQHRQERHGYVCCHLVYCVYLQWSNRGYSFKFSHHLLSSTLMESQVKFCCPQNVSDSVTAFC